jgi:hypothetical protein
VILTGVGPYNYRLTSKTFNFRFVSPHGNQQDFRREIVGTGAALRRCHMKKEQEANVWVSEDRAAVWVGLAIGAVGLVVLWATH